jgi:probable HAF family extracellular repeat protein
MAIRLPAILGWLIPGRLVPAAILLALSWTSGAQAGSVQLHVLDLGTLGGNGTTATDINNLGQVTGQSVAPDGSVNAFRTRPGAAIDPRSDNLNPGGIETFGTLINDAGQIVGTTVNGSFLTGPNRPFNPRTDQLQGFGPFGTTVRGINNSGELVAQLFDEEPLGSGPGHPVRRTPAGEIQRLDDAARTALGDRLVEVQVNDINDAGQAVGLLRVHKDAVVDTVVSFRTGPDAAIDVDNDLFGTIVANDGSGFPTPSFLRINARGEVAGTRFDDGGHPRAFRTPAGAMLDPLRDDLRTPGSTDNSVVALNDAGDVLVQDERGFGYFLIRDDGSVLDLSELFPADDVWRRLDRVTAINNRDEIIGQATDAHGTEHAVLLTLSGGGGGGGAPQPVPLPSAAPAALITLAGWRASRLFGRRSSGWRTFKTT